MSSDEERAPEPVAWLRKEIGDDLAFAQACLRRPMFGTDFEAVNERIARCEAELAILDEHALTWPDGEPEYENLDEAVTDSRGAVHYVRVKGALIPPYTCKTCGYGDGRPCKTVRLLASGYKHRSGYREEDWQAA